METAQGAARYRLFVGIDIAAATAMAAWQGEKGKVSRPVQIAQSPQGHADLHDKLGASGVPAGETLVMHCPKSMLGRESILLRIGVRQVLDGRPHVEYDEALEAVRPHFWWITGLPAWLVQGWTEKPKPAVTVAIALLLAAGLAARRRA